VNTGAEQLASYIRVSPEQIPLGQTALLLFVHHDELCAGVLEHRCDGRFDRRVPEDPSPNDLVLGICKLMAERDENSDLLVVLEPQAYWPDSFPKLRLTK
jgi:hypothetical protein